jgi:hypothetical protein
VGERDGIAGVTGMEASEQSRAPDLPVASNPPRYWFPAKRYGWGWGLPCTWQGWLVLAAYLGLMVGAARLCPPRKAWLASGGPRFGWFRDRGSSGREEGDNHRVERAGIARLVERVAHIPLKGISYGNSV